MRLDDLARRLNLTLEGPPAAVAIEVTSVASLASATASDLAFVLEPRHLAAAARSNAGALIVGQKMPAPARTPAFPLLRADEPALAAAQAIALLRPAWRPAPGIHPTASIHPSAVVGPGASIGAFVAIGEHCRLGRDAVLHPHVVLYPHVTAGDGFLAHAHAVVREGTVIGDGVTLQPGVVLGGDGFGFARRGDGSHAKIPQVGTVAIGDGAEIQANSCIDRASLDVTRIGPGTIIDNLVQVAHNCEVGADVILCSQVGLAGHTVIEDQAILAGQVGVAGHCTVGRGAVITAQSGTHGDIPPGVMISGSPGFGHAEWLRATSAFSRLPDMQRELRRLRAEIEQISARLSSQSAPDQS